MDIIKAIAGFIIGPVVLLLPVWLARRKSVPNFSHWMEAEGAPIPGQLFAWFFILFVAPYLLVLLLL